jgi:hypothetical protein
MYFTGLIQKITENTDIEAQSQIEKVTIDLEKQS